MSDPLFPSRSTFTVDRIRAEWNEGRLRYRNRKKNYQSHIEIKYDANHNLTQMRRFCLALYAAVKDPVGHRERLDEVFARELLVAKIPDGWWDGDEEGAVEYICHLLSRLPARPPDILASLIAGDFDASALDPYLICSLDETSELDPTLYTTWERLQVVAWVDKLVIRVIFGIILTTHRWGAGTTLFGPRVPLDSLLRLCFQLSSETVDPSGKRNWVIVKAFLWTSLQRTLMLQSWNQLEGALQKGYDYGAAGMRIRRLTSIPEISAQIDQQQLDAKKRMPYMCSWAYELLRNDRASVTTDLRRFHWCYRSLFGTRPARCKDGQRQCDGASPQGCQRFKGAVVADQSAHDLECDSSCRRLFWDRASFVNVPGAKAVCLTATDEKHLRYREASNKTLAISHVWSHGQGGRPESTGFNSCLHNRYAKVAKHFGCDSYWMDTPCIPNEKALRSECINNINKIFNQSMVTLVCDRDLMSIDVSNLTMDLKEAILATVLVSDWNLRAWTLLEAMRGRTNIHLLCKGNEVLGFKETLKDVSTMGRIDLATLFLATQHLLPAPDIDDCVLFDEPLVSEEDRMTQLGFISLGEASILLSRRHASRDRDDVVIWSLLVREKAIKDAAELWKSEVGSKINTGFLMSSSPRLQGHRGFSWAPTCLTPPPPPSTGSNQERYYPAYDGNNTQTGLITADGLQAKWLIHKFLLTSPDCDLRFPQNVRIARRYLPNYRWGAIFRPGQCPGTRYVAAPYKGKTESPLVAICGSHDGRCWEWRTVYEWDTSDPLADFDPYFRKPDAPPMDFILEQVLLV